MADTTIKATVTGEDKTAATFDRIANRIDNLAKKSDQAFDGMSIRQERGIAHGIEALMSGNALSGGYGLMHGLHDMVSASVGGGIMAGLAGFAVGGALENHLHLGEKLFDKIFGDPQIFLNTLDQVKSAIASMAQAAERDLKKLNAQIEEANHTFTRWGAELSGNSQHAGAMEAEQFKRNALRDPDHAPQIKVQEAEASAQRAAKYADDLEMLNKQERDRKQSLADVETEKLGALHRELTRLRSNNLEGDKDPAERIVVANIREQKKRTAAAWKDLTTFNETATEKEKNAHNEMMLATSKLQTAQAEEAKEVRTRKAKNRDEYDKWFGGFIENRGRDPDKQFAPAPYAPWMNAGGYGAVQATRGENTVQPMIDILRAIDTGTKRTVTALEAMQVA